MCMYTHTYIYRGNYRDLTACVGTWKVESPIVLSGRGFVCRHLLLLLSKRASPLCTDATKAAMSHQTPHHHGIKVILGLYRDNGK